MARKPGLLLVLLVMLSCSGGLNSLEHSGFIRPLEDITDYDTPPQLVQTVRPDYPDIARTMGAEGRVILKALVLEDGTVAAVDVIESPHPVLLDQAVEALMKSVFIPATRDGVPVRSTAVIPFIFDRQGTILHSRSDIRIERAMPAQGDWTYQQAPASEDTLRSSK
jgi:TonB family protein